MNHATMAAFIRRMILRELVQYAKERFVNILPEIDVPGHSLAAIASYPELSCTPRCRKLLVFRSGEEIKDWSHGHTAGCIDDNTFARLMKTYTIFR